MKFKKADRVRLKSWETLRSISIDNINDFNREEIEALEKSGLEVLHIPALPIDNYGIMLTSEQYEKFAGKIMIVSGVDEFGAIYVYGTSDAFPSMALIKAN